MNTGIVILGVTLNTGMVIFGVTLMVVYVIIVFGRIWLHNRRKRT
jgi:hypothetical protein